MPIPEKKKGEDKNKYMARCMGNETMKKDFPGNDQRVAVCMSKATEGMDYVEAADYQMYFDMYGSEEELDEDNFYIPHPEEYLTMAQIRAENYGYAVKEEDDEENEDDTETEDEDEEAEGEWDVAAERPGLWENIRRKKEREGKNYKPAKKGDPDRPDPEAWKKAQSKFKYKDPQTGEYFYFENQGVKEKNGKKLVYVGKAAEYQGRNVQLGKPFRTPDGPKKFSVYVKNDKGNVVKVNFGDPTTDIKRDDPERRKSFRARHNCDTNPAPRWKARYWSCMQWRSNKKVEG